MRGGIRSGSGIAALVGSLLFGAGESAAEWKVYVQGGLGISGAEVDTDGQVSDGVDTDLLGQDKDSSPLLDAAVGLEVPMDEIVPREFLLKVRLPDWPVRFELEAAGLREWEFRTVAGGEDFFTEVNATTVLINSWVDMPMIALYQPVQYLFGLGRQPNVRRWMEPMSLYVGTGIGLTAQMEIDGTSNVVSAQDDVVDFAWNVGTGINYQFTENIKLAVGYRYLGLGEPEIDARGQFAAGGDDSVQYDLDVHELRVALRINVFEFSSPWR